MTKHPDHARIHWNDAPLHWPDSATQDSATQGSAALHDPGVFHHKLPGYAPTPLREAPRSAALLGVRQLWVKDESNRLGLPAYKILGASWASYRLLAERVGGFQPWDTPEDLAAQLRAHLPLTLVAATDGNHGRAVARVARWLGLSAHILVPGDMTGARIDAISQEGAAVTVVQGSYDDAVEQAASLAGERHLVISDTAWEGYERVPQWVIDGYATMHHETDEQLAAMNEPRPQVVAVQIGVGALAASIVRHYRRAGSTSVVGVEPTRAACVFESVVAGQLTEVPGPHDSIMAGLNCGRPSPLAWPLVSRGISAFVAIPDTRAEQAMRQLARDGVVSGESGAAGLAGFLELLTGPEGDENRARLGLTGDSTLLVISTEGATDPTRYARIVGSGPQDVRDKAPFSRGGTDRKQLAYGS